MDRLRRARVVRTRGVPVPKPTDELDWDAIHEELSGYFNSNREARTALESLVAAGCRERAVLQNLYLFCGGRPQEMQAVRKALNFEGRRKRMLAIATLLKEASSEIGAAERLLEDLGLTHTLRPDCSSLDTYADFLNRVGKTAYRNLASGKISGRDQHLVFLAKYVESVTGDPHHREIAHLVDAMRLHYDRDYAERETPESIRKRVKRHSPNLILGLELEATLELEGHPTNKPRK
jgi:hypothetical protein